MTTTLSPRSRIGPVVVSAILLSGLSGCADPVNPEATLISVGDGVEIGIFGGRCAQIDDVATSFRSQPGGRVADPSDR